VKTCTKCGETKSFDAFGRNRRFHTGRHPQCRDCTNAASRKWHATHAANQMPLAWGRYRAEAKDHHRVFALPRALFDDLVTDNCFYCGEPPANSRNGIDRVDSSGGYTEDNVVTACTRCNMAKRRQTKGEFEAWASRVAFHLSESALPAEAARVPRLEAGRWRGL